MDPQVGPFQLGNSYYRRNVYDRGHLARRSAAAWGRTEEEAKAASDATMYYSNACLQHENFNQDEWLELEDWVKYLQDDVNDRVSVFSGPIYTRRDGTAKMIGSPRAEIPTAFFKVVCFVNKKGDLATVAFIMAQDAKAISDKNAKNRNFDRNTYQVSVKMIEDETGLLFDQRVKEANPIPYSPPPMSRGTFVYFHSVIITRALTVVLQITPCTQSSRLCLRVSCRLMIRFRKRRRIRRVWVY